MINYNIIAHSIQYYEKHGFQQISAPWIVPSYIDSLTKPYGSKSYKLKGSDNCLVASGEQSFLDLYHNEFMSLGRFQTVTPCFRFDNIDYIHSKYFIKNELIDTKNTTLQDLDTIIEIACKFFKEYLADIDVIKTSDGYDIISNGIELGSYGIRECEFLKWIYATGCAEPRLSKVLKLFDGVSSNQN